MSLKDRITRKLYDAFGPLELTVTDDSDQHRGHGGWREGGETHFSLYLVAEAFSGKSPLDRHRMINAVLAEELAGPVHALAIRARAPGEGIERGQ